MKILLIYPYFLERRIHEDEITVVPIGLFYVGATLREKGYDAKILNWSRVDRSMAEVDRTLSRSGPTSLVFQCSTPTGGGPSTWPIRPKRSFPM